MKFKRFRSSKECLKANKIQIFDEDGMEYTGPQSALDDFIVVSHSWSLIEEGTLVVRIKGKRRK